MYKFLSGNTQENVNSDYFWNYMGTNGGWIFIYFKLNNYLDHPNIAVMECFLFLFYVFKSVITSYFKNM